MKTFTLTAGIVLRARELWIKGRDFSTALWQPFFRKEDKTLLKQEKPWYNKLYFLDMKSFASLWYNDRDTLIL